MARHAPSEAFRELYAPTSLVQPLRSPSRPPRFQAPPTPPLVCCVPVRCTSSHARGHTATRSEEVLAPIFEVHQMGILQTPDSPPPRPSYGSREDPCQRQYFQHGGLSLQKVKRGGPCLTISAAKATEKLPCRSLGIVRDVEDVTEATIEDFTAKFKEQLVPEVIMAMRAFFHLDDPAVNSVEEALIDHGGEAAVESTQDNIEAELSLGSQ
ncbi:hypothetical protein D1007_56954 [Hordeum vulgare]|nr:hypothetical protein D1007_56954 [Hordeum vulgare]